MLPYYESIQSKNYKSKIIQYLVPTFIIKISYKADHVLKLLCDQ